MAAPMIRVMFFTLILIDTVLCYRDKYTKEDISNYREKAKKMFQHAYDGYIKYAYPYDELRPLTCDGLDTWGSYSLTLIDALDTLAIVGNYSEFRRVADLVINKMDFDIDINASVFETNIRILGGLLSAHLLSYRAGMDLEPGWPCSGPLLSLADQVARKLLPAFDTATGMPYGTVNLLHGVPKGETTITCTAGVGTFIVEFATLSRLTGDPVFEKTAMRAMRSLWDHRSEINLLGNHIDVATGKWTALDAGIGGGIDSYFEYLVKAGIMFQIPELLEQFKVYEKAANTYLKRDDWYMWANMKKGGITLPMFTSLDAYWPGIQTLLGNIDGAMKTIHNFHQVWKQFGFTPEYYNIPKADVHTGREGYPLRPELVESAMYLYRATKDPFLLDIGVDILESIEMNTKTECGYATVKNVATHELENRMESFFLAETIKYLYLLFDTENFIHNNGSTGTTIQTPNGECIIDAGGYFFNTEAHPIDVAAVYCCSAEKKLDDLQMQKMHEDIDLLALLDMSISDSKVGLQWKKLREEIEKEKLGKMKKGEDGDKSEMSESNQDEECAVDGSCNFLGNGGVTNENKYTEKSNSEEIQHEQQSDSKSETGDVEKLNNSGESKEINNEEEEPLVQLNTLEAVTEQLKDKQDIVLEEKHMENTEELSEKPSSSLKDFDLPKNDGTPHMSKQEKKENVNGALKTEKTKNKLKSSPNSVSSKSAQLNQLFDFIYSKISGKDKGPTHPNIYHLYDVMQEYSLDYSNKPEIMVCRAQPYHMKLSAMGEMFIDKDESV